MRTSQLSQQTGQLHDPGLAPDLGLLQPVLKTRQLPDLLGQEANEVRQLLRLQTIISCLLEISDGGVAEVLETVLHLREELTQIILTFNHSKSESEL